MADHYYSQKPTVTSQEMEIETKLLGQSIRYITDQGVFSKNGIDFGSRLLIESFFELWKKERDAVGTVLDLGCGYGAMGLALAKVCPNTHVSLIDINERAIALATKNANRLAIKNVSITQSDGLQNIQGRQFDCIITNPPIRAGKEMIHRWFEDVKNHLNSNGQLWIVIQKKQGAPSALKKLESIYPIVEEVEKEKGYFIYRAINA